MGHQAKSTAMPFFISSLSFYGEASNSSSYTSMRGLGISRMA